MTEPVPDDREMVVSRSFAAPRRLVFAAWTEERHLVRWWQPQGFAPPRLTRLDVRPGGGFRIEMQHDSGELFTAYGTYREVVAPERLVYDDYCEASGVLFHRARITVAFAEAADRTTVTLRGRMLWLEGREARWTPELMRLGWAKGWADNLALLERHLAGVPA